VFETMDPCSLVLIQNHVTVTPNHKVTLHVSLVLIFLKMRLFANCICNLASHL